MEAELEPGGQAEADMGEAAQRQKPTHLLWLVAVAVCIAQNLIISLLVVGDYL